MIIKMYEKQNNRLVGKHYEELVAKYLINNRYTILERNYRNKIGELDIIAELDGVLVIVEVKYRHSNQYGDPLEAVNWKKQHQISRTLFYYVVQNGIDKYRTIRFDVIGIHGDGSICHIQDAFEFK